MGDLGADEGLPTVTDHRSVAPAGEVLEERATMLYKEVGDSLWMAHFDEGTSESAWIKGVPVDVGELR